MFLLVFVFMMYVCVFCDVCAFASSTLAMRVDGMFAMKIQVAVYAQGSNDEKPFTFATAVPRLTFHWSTTNMDVIALVSIYDKVLP